MREPIHHDGGSRGEAHVFDLARLVLERRWLFIAYVVVAVAAASAHALSQTPLFKSSALVLIEPRRGNVANARDVYDPLLAGGAEAFKKHHELLRSRLVLEPVYRESSRRGASDAAPLDEGALLSFVRRVSIEPIGDGSLVRVGFTSPRAEETARVADAVVQSYVRFSAQRALGVTDAGLRSLRDEAKEMRVRVEAAAAAIEGFKRDSGLLLLGDGQTVYGDRLTSIQEQLSALRSERMRVEADLAVARGDAGSIVVEGKAVERLDELRGRIGGLEDERQELLLRLTPEHPLIVDLDARIAVLRRRLTEAIGTETEVVRERLEARKASLERAEAALATEVEAATQQAFESIRQRTQFRFLQQEHESTETAYKRLMERVREIELAASTGGSDQGVFVIEPAPLPTEPINASPTRLMGGALLFALVSGVGLCLVASWLDRSVKGPVDAVRRIGAPALGAVPAAGPGRAETVTHDTPSSPFAEAMRLLRTSVTFGVRPPPAGAPRRLVVTSALPGEGKTVVAVNLAIALAQAGKRVLLVDADMRRPRVAPALGLPSEPGLSNLLAGESPLAPDLLRATSIRGLSVLPTGTVPPSPADLLGDERCEAVLAAVEAGFEWVIVDAPPVLGMADAVLLAGRASGALLVVRTFATRWDAAQRAREELASVGGHVIGIVLNDVDAPTGRGALYEYGYGYGSGAGGSGRVIGGDGPIAREAGATG